MVPLVTKQLWPHLAHRYAVSNLHKQLLFEYISVNVESHSSQTGALVWVDTTHYQWTDGKGETSAVIARHGFPCCTRTHCIHLFSCMRWVCVVQTGEKWRWEGEHAWSAIWCLSCKRSNANSGNVQKQRRQIEKKSQHYIWAEVRLLKFKTRSKLLPVQCTLLSQNTCRLFYQQQNEFLQGLVKIMKLAG